MSNLAPHPELVIERLEAWLSYGFAVFRFLERHAPKGSKWILDAFPGLLARGELFLVEKGGKIIGAGAASLVTVSLLDEALEGDELVKRWGSGDILFCLLAIVLPSHRGRSGVEILERMLESGRKRFPQAKALAFQRIGRDNRIHLWPFPSEKVKARSTFETMEADLEEGDREE